MKTEEETTDIFKVCPNCGAENCFTEEQLRSYETEYYCDVCGWDLRRCP